jgi:hypothetical protein
MKIIVAILLMTFLARCNSGADKKIRLEVPPRSGIDSGHTEIKQAMTLLPKYKDSMNNYKLGWTLPTFLYNDRLDLEYPWQTDHNVYSLRKRVFDSTTNVDVLNAIINSADVRLSKIADPDSVYSKKEIEATPYSKISTRELAKKRIRELAKLQSL